MPTACLSLLLAAMLAAPSLAAAPLLAQAVPPGPSGAPAMSDDELELLRKSLRPAGLAELESHAAPLSQLPLSEVEAALEPDKGRIDGHLRLIFTNREGTALSELVLRLLPNAPALKAASALRADEIQIDGVAARSRAHGSLLEIALPASLEPGQALVLTLAFHGKLSRLRAGDEALAGLTEMLAQLSPGLGAFGGGGTPAGTALGTGRGSEPYKGSGTFTVGSAGTTLVDWYPFPAARMGGAWDLSEPGTMGSPLHAEVGSAIVSLSVPRGYRVLGAGSPLGQHLSGKGEVAGFALAGVRGALDLAVLADTTAVTRVDDELRPEGDPKAAPLHLHVASLHGAQGARALGSCARAALLELGPRWGAYPWSDLLVAEMPLASGATGAWGSGFTLVARGLGGGVGNPLLDPSQAADPDANDPSPEAPGLFTFHCYGGVARQWIPGVIGTDPRAAPWLDEALAVDAAVRTAAAQAGGGDPGQIAADTAERRFVALGFQGMRAMGLPDARVDQRADAFHTLPAWLGLIDGKGPLFLARVRALTGDDRFDEALRSLRAQRAFREAAGTDLLAALGKADPARVDELDALAGRWLRELHGDEDIAPLDASDLLDGLGGGGAGVAQMAQLMRLMGAGAFPSGVPPVPMPNSAAGPSQARSQQAEAKALRKAMRELERSVPQLKQLLQQLLPPNARP